MAEIDTVVLQRAQQSIRLIAERTPVRAAFLFGSHVTGRADRFSDIDIAAFIEKYHQWDIQQRTQLMVWVQKNAGDDLELHFFPAEMAEEAPPASFAAFVAKNGVPIPMEEAYHD